MQKARVRKLAAILPVRQSALKECAGTDHIGPYKLIWSENRSIDVRFGRKVGNLVKCVLREQVPHEPLIAYVTANEGDSTVGPKLFEAGRVACVGDLVQNDDLLVHVKLNGPVNEILADKAGTARDQNGRSGFHCALGHFS